MGQTSREKEKSEQCGSTYENKKVAVVSASDTVVKPDAMMVLGLDAVVTHAAVVCARGAPDVAAFAVLGGHLHCSTGSCRRNNHGPFSRRRSETQWIIIRIRWRKRMEIAGQDLQASERSGRRDQRELGNVRLGLKQTHG